MSPTFMIWPASMKRGIASNGNWLTPANILWGRTLRNTNCSASTKPARGAKTSANTMGTPNATAARKMKTKVLDTTRRSSVPPGANASRRR